ASPAPPAGRSKSATASASIPCATPTWATTTRSITSNRGPSAASPSRPTAAWPAGSTTALVTVNNEAGRRRDELGPTPDREPSELTAGRQRDPPEPPTAAVHRPEPSTGGRFG